MCRLTPVTFLSFINKHKSLVNIVIGLLLRPFKVYIVKNSCDGSCLLKGQGQRQLTRGPEKKGKMQLQQHGTANESNLWSPLHTLLHTGQQQQQLQQQPSILYRVGSSTFTPHMMCLLYFWKQLWLSKLRCSDQVIHLCQREECKNGSELCWNPWLWRRGSGVVLVADLGRIAQ